MFGAASAASGQTAREGDDSPARDGTATNIAIMQPPASEDILTPDDKNLLRTAREAANGAKFTDLWEGRWQGHHYASQSEADLALCAHLAFWTNRDAEWIAHLFRLSGLYRPAKWTQHAGHGITYGQSLLIKALRVVDEGYTGKGVGVGMGLRSRRPAPEATVAHSLAYPWQERDETPEAREAHLEHIRDAIRHDVLDHLAQGDDAVLVIAAPPGVGKSHAVAALGLGDGRNLAWIAERKNMVDQVALLRQWHVIRAADADNCPEYLLHQELAQRGYNTWSLHKRHTCAYKAQFGAPRSTVYQLPHVPTCYPAQHQDGIIIDELNLARWLNQVQPVTRGEAEDAADRYRASARLYKSDKPAYQLLNALAEVLHEAKRNHMPQLTGRALFDALARACGGRQRLANLLEILFDDVMLRDARPRVMLPDMRGGSGEQAALAEATALPRVMLPTFLDRLEAEYPHWRHGLKEWNSWLAIGPNNGAHGQHSQEYVLRLLGPQRFARPWTDTDDTGVMDDMDVKTDLDTNADSEEAEDGEGTADAEEAGDAAGLGKLPPRVVLDATGDEALYRRLFGVPVSVKQEPLDPPPHMRHIAVRLATPLRGIKRFGKTNMTKHDASYRQRTVRQIQHVLRELGLDDATFSQCKHDRVGLITFKDCEEEMRTALGIPKGRSGHFFAQRGSNAMEDCAVLLVVGTPAQAPDVIYRMACALWHDDPRLLDPAAGPADDGTFAYADARLQALADYLTRAELTQCAHRNRPLRHDGRVVVTFCNQEIDFLPATTEVTHLPRGLDEGGFPGASARRRADERMARLQAAYEQLRQTGIPFGQRELAREANTNRADAGRFLRDQRHIA